MKAIFLVKNGKPEQAFDIREAPIPEPAAGEVLLKVEGFGLNFADVMARLGLYPDAPDKPGVLGYDVVGRVEKLGAGVDVQMLGKRVTAMTRFGGYAEYAVTNAMAMAEIPDDMDVAVGTALTTQYCTAYYNACEMVRLRQGDHVLVHAAAGGVGTATVQLAKHAGCVIYGTVGSDEKFDYIRAEGVDHPINYRSQDFVTEVNKIVGDRGLDVIFDPVGGKTLKQGLSLLGSGGRLITFGASSINQAKTSLGKIRTALQFGFHHPLGLLRKSQSLLGVNMLRIADNRPEVLKHVLEQVVSLTDQGILAPKVGGTFQASEIAEAHALLESRKSTGKIALVW